MSKPSIPQGMRDFAPEVMLRRNWIFDTIKTVFRKYGYMPLETPTMENLSVLTGKYGEEGDKLIFKVLNSGDFLSKSDMNTLTEAKENGIKGATKLAATICEKALRYDLTVPFARFVVMNHANLTYPFKRYQIQPVWRADRPQNNRYREFYQCDADVVGAESLLYDAEFICIYDEALSNMGMKNFSIQVNNRKILSGYAEYIGETEKFTDICVAIDKLDKIGEDGVKKELLEKEIAETAVNQLFEVITFEGTNEEKIAFLEAKFENCPEGKKGVEEMKQVFRLLSHLKIQHATVEFTLLLARGLNYYTGAIYEVKSNETSVNVSIGGGGRYDNLTGVFGLQGIKGIGISFGADRIYNVLSELNLFPETSTSGLAVMVANFGEDTLPASLEILQMLRDANIASELYPENAKMKKQFAYADKKGIPLVIIIGEEELQSGVYQVKNLKTGAQSAVTKAEVVSYIVSQC